MCIVRNLRVIGIVLGGVLAAAGLFTVPKHASSAYREGDAIMGAIVYARDKSDRWEYQPNNPEGWGGITRNHSYHRPMVVTSQLFPNHEDCAAVKVDIWLGSGRLTYSLFNNPETDAPPADTTDVPGRTTMLIGEKNCRVRVLIERADDN
jgi:hypothetical protein